MTAPDSLPLHALAEANLTAASPDLLRAMIKTFADALMSAEADALCNAEYGQVSDERVNHRNGYRPREWETRADTVELAVPKLRQGSYFPHWLLERRRRAEQALISVVATAYLLGVSTRRVEKLAESFGVTQLPKSQVSAMAKHLDEQVAAFPNRPLDTGLYSFVWVDALTQKVREGGRIINVHALIAVGVNADGHREILGIDVATAEDGAGWLAFLRSLIARGLSGVQLVISDAHAGLVDAIGAVLPGASWQRCRTHYARNLLSQVPKSAQPWVATLLRTVFEQPNTDAVQAQMAHVLNALEAKFPKAAALAIRVDRSHDPQPVHRRDEVAGHDAGVPRGPGIQRRGSAGRRSRHGPPRRNLWRTTPPGTAGPRPLPTCSSHVSFDRDRVSRCNLPEHSGRPCRRRPSPAIFRHRSRPITAGFLEASSADEAAGEGGEGIVRVEASFPGEASRSDRSREQGLVARGVRCGCGFPRG